MADLRELIDAFVVAKIAFNAMPDDDDAPAEWETFIETELAIIVYPCSSLEDVRLKARFFLDHAGSNDELRNGSYGGEQSLDLFLRSLLGEAQPCA